MQTDRSDDEGHPVGALVIRVWYDGDPPVVKARFVGQFDVLADPDTKAPPQYAMGLDDIAATAREWLAYYLAMR